MNSCIINIKTTFLIVITFFNYFVFAQRYNEIKNENIFFDSTQIKKDSSSIRQSFQLNLHENNYSEFYHIITDVPKDFIDFGNSIFSEGNLMSILILSTVTTGLIVNDYKLWKITKEKVNRSNLLNSFTHTFVETGNAKWHLGLSATALMFGYFTDNTRLKNTAFEATEAVIASGFFVQILKRISGRQSPATHTIPGGYWDLFPDLGEYQHRQPEYYAFPSGHITSATAFLTVIKENYPEIKWIAPVSYGIIALLGFSVVSQDMHWYSDLPLGIAIGYLFGKIISKRYLNDNEKYLNKKYISIIPSISNGNYSISITYNFN